MRKPFKGLTQSTIEFTCHLKRGNPEIDESNGYDQCYLTGTFRRFTQNSKPRVLDGNNTNFSFLWSQQPNGHVK